MVEYQEAAVKFLVPHQELSESVELTVRYFHDPSPRPFLGITFEFVGLLSASFNVRNVAMFLNDFQRWRPAVVRIDTPIFVASSVDWASR